VNGAPSRTASAVTASERCSTASCTKCPIPCKLCPGPGSCSRGTSNPHVQMM
jgi:hypothetical protein